MLQALTHRSAVGDNNERLEFLGDSILNMVIAELLYRSKSKADEGALSRMRASVVNKSALASVASELDLGKYLLLGPGEKKSGGYRRESTQADAVEAIIGAVFLDSGFDNARKLIELLFKSLIDELPDEIDLKDPKTRLQEFLQSRRKELPVYEVIEVKGKEHEQTFTVQCSCLDPQAQSQGVGTSRRKAEQDAADKLLIHLGIK